MSKNEIQKIGDGIYQIKYYWLGMANVYMYLIVGEEKAFLIDTGYSITHAREYATSVTNLPVEVVNTHGHFDHIGGDADFEKVYLSSMDWKVAGQHSDYGFLSNMMKHYKEVNLPVQMLLKLKKFNQPMEESLHIRECRYTELPAEEFFDLGNRKVSYLETPGHTEGSICLMDEKTGYFFTGDMLCEEGVLLGFDHSTTVSEYAESVKRMQRYFQENNGKKLIPSHHKVPVTPDIFERYLSLCEDLLSGREQGEYVDDGISQGLSLKKNGLQMIYREL